MKPKLVLVSNKVWTDEQLRAVLSVGLDHPIIRAVSYLIEVRVQRAMQDMDPKMAKSELTYLLGRQDGLLATLGEIRAYANIDDRKVEGSKK